MNINKRLVVPLSVLFIGILLVVLSVFEGDAEIALLLFIPVIYGSGIFFIMGILLLFLSFILFFVFSAGSLQRVPHQRKGAYKKTESSYGGVIFLGPIPIVFGKDKSITKKMMWIGLVIALILFFLYLMIIF